MEKCRAIIIDDEPNCIQGLHIELERHCPSVEVIGSWSDSRKARNEVDLAKVDLIFLDIEMPHLNGFDLLQAWGPGTYEVIFTTAYNQFAIKAFKVNACDYLLKPIDRTELLEAVARVNKRLANRQPNGQIEQLLQHFRSGHQRLRLPTSEGFEFVETDDILFCRAESNYTEITFRHRPPLLISKTLKSFEDSLSAERFMRVHNSYLINISGVRKYVKSDGGYLLMQNDDQIPISRGKKDQILSRL